MNSHLPVIRFLSVFLLITMLPAFHPAHAREISLESLLDEMVDRERLARLPEPAYTCKQFSSYDRKAQVPGGEGWFANYDNKHYLRTEERAGRTEHVLMDTAGPGAIVRFWTTIDGAGDGNGTLRFYLDGGSDPSIEGELFHLISGTGLALPPLAACVPQTAEPDRRGHNLYLPIPYAASCKVTYEPVDDRCFFYQINYRTYPEGTKVKTFTLDGLAGAGELLAETQYTLNTQGRDLPGSWNKVSFTAHLTPGAVKGWSHRGRPGAVQRLLFNLRAADRDQALRSTVLKIDFDGEQCVWCPVGDFFGTGHQIHPFRTWYTETTADGTMACRWVMPFQEKVKIKLHNLGEQDVHVVLGEVATSDWSWDDRSMHFHSTWRQLYRVETGGPHGARDVNFVTVKGEGVYAGDTLTLFNGTKRWGWWGEGDEKIFIDEEPFPSHFGTGSEDYYGYAWARSQRFESAFHAQPCGAGNEYAGYSVNSRYRSLDAIPFTRAVRFDMELWHWAVTRINYAPSTFWYALPGATCNVDPDPEGAAKAVARTREDVVQVFRVNGALEGEVMKIASCTGGETEVQHGFPPRWSDEEQIWWRDGNLGDKLTFEFQVKEAGVCEVFAGLTRARDYGMVKLSINGEAAEQPFDRYHETLGLDELRLGRFDLKKGVNILEVEITGANEKAIQRRMFGLDYLRLEEGK